MDQLFVYIGYLILLLNLTLFIKGYPNQGKAFKIFTWYLGIIFVIQIVSSILNNMSIHNLFLSHFYFIGQFIVLSLFFISIFKKTYQKRIIKTGLFVGLLVLAFQYVKEPSLFFKFNLFEIIITSILLVTYATFHFYNLLVSEKKEFYYINTGILLYLVGSSVLFLVGNLMLSLSPKLNKIPWILNAFLYIFYQLFILVEWKKNFSNKNIQLGFYEAQYHSRE
jgi:hypothetical protein